MCILCEIFLWNFSYLSCFTLVYSMFCFTWTSSLVDQFKCPMLSTQCVHSYVLFGVFELTGCVCLSLLSFLFTNFDSAWLTSSFRAPAASKIHTLYGQWSGKDQSGHRGKEKEKSRETKCHYSLHCDTGTGTIVMHVTFTSSSPRTRSLTAWICSSWPFFSSFSNCICSWSWSCSCTWFLDGSMAIMSHCLYFLLLPFHHFLYFLNVIKLICDSRFAICQKAIVFSLFPRFSLCHPHESVDGWMFLPIPRWFGILFPTQGGIWSLCLSPEEPQRGRKASRLVTRVFIELVKPVLMWAACTVTHKP